MNEPSVVHKAIEFMQIACIKTVIEKRADIFPLFEPLRQVCGEAVCGPAMAVYHYGAVQTGFLVEAAFPVSRPVETWCPLVETMCPPIPTECRPV